jgi:hypothetical protein
LFLIKNIEGKEQTLNKRLENFNQGDLERRLKGLELSMA